jgi:hypothetical protein
VWCFPNVILQQMAARTDVDAQGDCEKEYERDYSWLHCRNGTALREVVRTLKRLSDCIERRRGRLNRRAVRDMADSFAYFLISLVIRRTSLIHCRSAQKSAPATYWSHPSSIIPRLALAVMHRKYLETLESLDYYGRSLLLTGDP